MKISILGTGYVGLVTGACLADVGHEVICVDIDKNKISSLQQGVVNLFEPGLESLVRTNLNANRLFFTNDTSYAVSNSDIIFIAVGTPMSENGSANLNFIFDAAKTIGESVTENDTKIVVCKSTVPVGTSDKIKEILLKSAKTNTNFYVASNPEFLKEGDAIKDFMRPDRIIIGSEDNEVKIIMEELYSPFNRNHQKIIFMDVRSAELTKYAANLMLATRISFMNEMANISELVGADIESVRQGIGSDSRIGYDFIYPGCGFGGSCFPKDISALKVLANSNGYNADILSAVENINARQKTRLIEKVIEHYGESIEGKTFALWGLAFKPKTDDMREAPSQIIINELIKRGAKIQAYDPKAMTEAKRIFQDTSITFATSKDAALECANALIICTEWQDFKAPNFQLLYTKLSDKVIFDGRNLFQPKHLQKHGLSYYSIGRQTIKAKATETK